MTKLNLFLSSQTGLCFLILHPLLLELVTLTFYLLLMQEILGSRSHPTEPRTSMSQTSSDPLTLNCGRISSIRHLLTVTATKTLLSAFVLSKLDYCNSLLCGSPQFILHTLQRVQNSAASLVMETPQVWSCTASFAQPTLVTSLLTDWLQDFNPVRQHFHQLLSHLYRSASMGLHPFQTLPFILGHTHLVYSFHEN